MRGRVCAEALAFVLVLAAALIAATERVSSADEGAPSADRIQAAAQEYDTGRRAYMAGAFAEAAVHFENAYNDAPRPEPLRSAIRARLAAHDDARAATLASLARVRYGSDEATLALANGTLTQLEGRLLGVSVSCAPGCAVAADGRAASLEDAKDLVFYLPPGKHSLTISWSGDRVRELPVEGPAGSIRELRLDAPPLTPSAPKPAVVAPAGAGAPAPLEASHDKPLGPAVFIVGTAITVVGIGATIASGIDTLNDPGPAAVKRDCVGRGASCPEYQHGVGAQLRTNVLLGATAGALVVTAVIGVFFTQWAHGAASANAPRVSPYAGASQRAFDVGLDVTF